ncbi:MAG TPA: NAD-dependent epimerase/dehydratase family protein [Sphingomonas sp.]|jgi:dihydroflavonol-4-reductase|nr:NAD-dependent epimerase/dehydratase family protein [Sphingomonas sp.]
MAGDLVLVTGASGFIAGHAIVQLIERGYRVRGTLRSLKRADEVRGWLTRYMGRDPGDTLEFVEAELTHDRGWSEAMAGVRYVLHVASPIPPSLPKHPDELIVPAREGTLRVMRAAAAAEVERVVQTSSTAAITYGTDPTGRTYTEEDWTVVADPAQMPYVASKTFAERAAWDELPKLPRKLEWATVNPALVIGPVMDKDASASIEAISKLLDGSVPGLPRFGWPMVDVRDLADLHIRAMTDPKAAGERFLGSGPALWMGDVAAILKQRLGARAKRAPTRKLPDFVVRLVGLFDPAVRSQVFDLGKIRHASSAKAERLLGWTQRPIEDAIVDTAESLFAVGAIKD